MSRPALAFVLVLALAPLASAAPRLDPEAAAPTAWAVSVHFAPHATLAAPFRARVVRELEAALQSGVGELAAVRVVDLGLVPEAERSPLQKGYLAGGFAALEGSQFRELTGVKNHFVRVAVAGGAVTLEARQHDGFTGLATPAVRRQQTQDPQTVGRLLGLMLSREFGAVGTLALTDKPGDLETVHFRGGSLPGLERQVVVGDVLAVARVLEQRRPAPPPPLVKPAKPAPAPPPLLIGQPQEYTLLRVETPVSGGACRCRVLTRYATPFALRGGLGFRVLKLTTVDAPVEVRVVDRAGQETPADTRVQVRANDVDFLPKGDPRERFTFSGGAYRSGRSLRNVACVVVNLGTRQEERFPVPVVDGRPITLKFFTNPQLALRAEFDQAYDDFRARLSEARTTQATLFNDLARLITSGKNPEALERIVKGLETLKTQEQSLTQEVAQLRAHPVAKEADAAKQLEGAADLVRGLDAARPRLEQRAEEIRALVGKDIVQADLEKEFRAKEIVAGIRQALERGEVPQALELYDDLLKLAPSQAVQEQRAKLAGEWEAKTPVHAEARQFLLGPWRQVASLTDFAAAVPQVGAAVKVMAEAGDRHGLRNFLSSCDLAYSRLKDIVDRLDSGSEADQDTFRQVKQHRDAILKLEEEARAKLAGLEK